jgi:hypothetical protein
MSHELNKVEVAISASSTGDLEWSHWSMDHIVALGMSGVRNPLGFAMVQYLSGSNSAVEVWGLLLHLATEMEKRGQQGGAENHECAFQAFEFWKNGRCPQCHGRGVFSRDQRLCPDCGGTGKKPMPNNDAVKLGITCLNEAENWMESQLRHRTKQ